MSNYSHTGSAGYYTHNPYTTHSSYNTGNRHNGTSSWYDQSSDFLDRHAYNSHSHSHTSTRRPSSSHRRTSHAHQDSSWYNDSTDFLNRHADTSSSTRRSSHSHHRHNRSDSQDPFAFLYKDNAMDYAPLTDYPARYGKSTESHHNAQTARSEYNLKRGYSTNPDAIRMRVAYHNEKARAKGRYH